jgi:hypothetical protein
MTKYAPLQTFLARKTSVEVPLRFDEIEGIIGAPLPPVAFNHRAWWSNNPSNSVATRAWLNAGYKTERVDMGSQKLVFRRVGLGAEPAPGPAGPPRGSGLLAAFRQALGGTVTVAPGVDLTTPSGEQWDAEVQ